ncbi:MAG: hypothetical protein Q7T51_03600 [Candidatus Moranbacteria bacterium]|nr:hypothetical protein [Candidatus Moranbacteria bacterium]
MKKIFTILGLTLSVVLLAGCSSKTEPQKESGAPAQVKEAPAAVVLPEAVVTKPGETADDEVKNIEKDLQSIDDVSLNQGLSDDDLGL